MATRQDKQKSSHKTNVNNEVIVSTVNAGTGNTTATGTLQDSQFKSFELQADGTYSLRIKAG